MAGDEDGLRREGKKKERGIAEKGRERVDEKKKRKMIKERKEGRVRVPLITKGM